MHLNSLSSEYTLRYPEALLNPSMSPLLPFIFELSVFTKIQRANYRLLPHCINLHSSTNLRVGFPQSKLGLLAPVCFKNVSPIHLKSDFKSSWLLIPHKS
jgi:hypothetical protein